MIFVLRQIQEKCREQNMGLYVAFMDLTKAFDTVSRDGLWKIMTRLGCPPKLKFMVHHESDTRYNSEDSFELQTFMRLIGRPKHKTGTTGGLL